MAVQYILNAQGQDEERDGVKGITIFYAGIGFWFPFMKVTPIPNFTRRELNHKESTPEEGQVAVLTYNSIVDKAEIVKKELLDKEKPYSYTFRGIRAITGKPTGEMVEVKAGFDSDGSPLTIEVPERVATAREEEECLKAADEYEKIIVQQFLHSHALHRQGKPGQALPDPQTRLYMDRRGIEIPSDLSANMKAGGTDPVAIAAMVKSLVAQGVEAELAKIAEKRMERKIVTQPRKRSLGLAEHKAAKEAAEKETVGA